MEVVPRTRATPLVPDALWLGAILGVLVLAVVSPWPLLTLAGLALFAAVVAGRARSRHRAGCERWRGLWADRRRLAVHGRRWRDARPAVRAAHRLQRHNRKLAARLDRVELIELVDATSRRSAMGIAAGRAPARMRLREQLDAGRRELARLLDVLDDERRDQQQAVEGARHELGLALEAEHDAVARARSARLAVQARLED